MRYLNVVGALAVGVALAACGDNSSNNDSGGQADMKMSIQPAGTVAVNFSVDDSANKVYKQGDLVWKGSMIYDESTRKVTRDTTWGGPWAPLYDDGPWDAGGHEPAGSKAGDSIWGVTVFATPPMTGSDAYEYGLIDNAYETMFGNGWVWRGSNGSFTVNMGATMPVKAEGQVFAKFGSTDLQLTLDPAMVDTTMFNTTYVAVKSSGWAWGEQQVMMANGKFTFTMSEVIGAGKPFAHTGLFSAGDKPEFVWVLGTSKMAAKEYKDMNMVALSKGITAATKASGTTMWTPATVMTNNTSKNTYVTIP